jgi:hypothetical protein
LKQPQGGSCPKVSPIKNGEIIEAKGRIMPYNTEEEK